MCACGSGYEGNGHSCLANECALGVASCSPHGRCVDTATGYDCLCQRGYAGDGVTCINVDECAAGLDTCSPNATCVDTEGSFTCSCGPGFSSDAGACDDVNECTDGTLTCGLHEQCVNTNGSATCACATGYRLSGATCVNINECTEITPAVCGAHGTCMDLDGSHTCTCEEGYSAVGGGCVDLDECTLGNTGCDPGATCQEGHPGYRCVCGGQLVGNGMWCDDPVTSEVQMFGGLQPTLEVEGLGSVDVGGLSRVGMAFDITTYPNGGGGDRKFPGLLRVPNITFRNLTGTSTAISALALWASSANPVVRSAILTLRGVGPELLSLRLVTVVPVSHGTASGNTYSELVVSVASLSEQDWVGADWDWPCPLGGWEMEVAGIAGPPPTHNFACGLAATLPQPAYYRGPWTASLDEPIHLKALPGGRYVLNWMKATQMLAISDGVADERDVSIIHKDAADMEQSRINGYRVWPASMTFFNPTRPYGESPLVDVTLVCGFRWEKA